MKSIKSVIVVNRLLGRVPAGVLARCERVDLQFAQVLCEAGTPISHVYFPIDSFISLISCLEGGEKLEVGIVGDEGLLGVSLALGVGLASHHALVQGAGSALRMTAKVFSRQINTNAPFKQQLDRYVDVLMRQLALTTGCNHYHDVSQRLARWLLLTRDRARSDEFRLTQEFLSYMLGVRRVGITEAATDLQRRGLIAYRRGQIAILNGPGLETAACPCYRQAASMYEHTLNAPKKKVHPVRSERAGL